MPKSSKKTLITKKKVMVLVLVLIAAGLSFLILEKRNVINLYSSNDAPASADDAKTTSTAPSAQEDFNEGGEREPGNSLQENEGSGTISDQQGNATAQTDPGSWTTSSSGEISIHSPTRNSSVKTGAEVSGTSTLSTVSYRLIDNVSGLIAQGELNVVNGRFAGRLNFNTTATEGRLDVFGTKQDGVEFSNVEVLIKFN